MEHVFPASLGGRRKNSSIYCHKHDNSYSSLVAELDSQLRVFNAYLGVSSDHTKVKKVVKGIDSKSGLEIAISAESIKFTKPKIISERVTENGKEVYMNFPDKASMRQWQKEMADAGTLVTNNEKPTTTTYFPGTVRHQISLGGPIGLGALAYLMQTFTAQEFPTIARSGAIADFIIYTQAVAKVAGLARRNDAQDSEDMVAAQNDLKSSMEPFGDEQPVWWDFATPINSKPNAFLFGHRVTVGVDHVDGLVYARFSLFNALHYAANLGWSKGNLGSHEVIIDIDPLAIHPPHDISRTETEASISRVEAPQNRTDELMRQLGQGTQQKQFTKLMERLEEHQLLVLVKRMELVIKPTFGMSVHDRRVVLAQVIDKEGQQVWRLLRNVLGGFAELLRKQSREEVAKIVDVMISEDANSGNGLSPSANAGLALAKETLINKIEEEIASGTLDESRLAELMGRGEGMVIVGKPLFDLLLNSLPGSVH
jgi:hypothetical protein